MSRYTILTNKKKPFRKKLMKWKSNFILFAKTDGGTVLLGVLTAMIIGTLIAIMTP